MTNLAIIAPVFTPGACRLVFADKVVDVQGLVTSQAPGLCITPAGKLHRYAITQQLSGRTVSTLTWELDDAKKALLCVAPLADWTQDIFITLTMEEKLKLYVAIIDAWDAANVPTEHYY